MPIENWYLPLTIVPGIGLIILSTSNLMITLSNEIRDLIDSTSKDKIIITKKLAQLKLLNKGMVFFYISIGFILVATVINGLDKTHRGTLYVGILAVFCSFMGILSLIVYSFRAVTIRQNQFKKVKD